jgi:hypothetical protein
MLIPLVVLRLLREITMKLHKSPGRGFRNSNTDEEDDREFRDFVESISVSKEELVAIVSTLEFSSIHGGDECLQEDKGKRPAKTKAFTALREFQRRFQRGWEVVATAFVAPGAPEHPSRSPRKT